MLPTPVTKTKVEPLKFSVGAEVVHRLGTESVSEQVLAVIELVKNSYDDDAEKVEITLNNLRTGNASIIIEDDGNGMIKEQLIGSWMRIATDTKVREPLSPNKKRRRLGQKGIGRFAVENLSRKTIIATYPRNCDKGYEVEFDWDKYTGSAEITSIENVCHEFGKAPEISGLKIELHDLRRQWSEDDVRNLLLYLQAMTPPNESATDFAVRVNTDEFRQLSGKVSSSFLDKAVFILEAELSKTCDMTFKFTAPGKKFVREVQDKKELRCGPLKFKLYFFYRDVSTNRTYGVNIPNINEHRALLDDYGGIKIYRDGMRLSSFGNPGDDWAGLDALSRNNPTVIPSNNQVIATIYISSQENPEINDTATRENLIRNSAFKDMLEFIDKAIAVFSQVRGELEQKRQPVPKKKNDYVSIAQAKLKKNANRNPLLECRDRYPYKVFYARLEEEINLCWVQSLPNATLLLSRKLVENLLYNLLFFRFPNELDLRYNIDRGHVHSFSHLVCSLKTRKKDFDREQQDLIEKLLLLIEPFRREANSKAHNAIEYVRTLDEVDQLKIPEIVELELQLIEKVKVHPA